jgi:hypothetical protein
VRLRNTLSAVVALLGILPAAAQTPPDARARASLALAKARGPEIKTPVPPELAPAPRPVPPVITSLGAAREAAVRENKTAVLYVGCPGDHPMVKGSNMVTARIDVVDGYPPKSILVCYPQNGNLWVLKTLGCASPEGDVIRAVDAADGKKTVVPRTDRKIDWY